MLTKCWRCHESFDPEDVNTSVTVGLCQSCFDNYDATNTNDFEKSAVVSFEHPPLQSTGVEVVSGAASTVTSIPAAPARIIWRDAGTIVGEGTPETPPNGFYQHAALGKTSEEIQAGILKRIEAARVAKTPREELMEQLLQDFLAAVPDHLRCLQEVRDVTNILVLAVMQEVDKAKLSP